MEVGPAGSAAGHAANPTSLHDVFFRIGGAGRRQGHHQPGGQQQQRDRRPHVALARRPRRRGVGWTTNTADNGLIVNGDDVTMYGLFVEHYQKYQTIWNGNGGRTYFYQNEMPYDPPNQAAWMNGATRGLRRVQGGRPVTSHEAWGLGSYCYFNTNPAVVADRAFEVPDQPERPVHEHGHRLARRHRHHQPRHQQHRRHGQRRHPGGLPDHEPVTRPTAMGPAGAAGRARTSAPPCPSPLPGAAPRRLDQGGEDRAAGPRRFTAQTGSSGVRAG